MEKFTQVSAIAAPLRRDSVDTDQIIPIANGHLLQGLDEIGATLELDGQRRPWIHR